jgi:hypothetical protein
LGRFKIGAIRRDPRAVTPFCQIQHRDPLLPSRSRSIAVRSGRSCRDMRHIL